MEEPQVVAPLEAQPRQADPARDELFTAVHELTATVKAMQEGRGDPATVERLTDEVMELRERLDRQEQPTGYVPPDESAERQPIGVHALAALHAVPARVAAVRLNRPEIDIHEFREKADGLLLLAAAVKKDPRDLKYYAEHYLPALAAIDTQTTAEGKEFVPTILSADLIQRVEVALRVVGLFRQIEMPSNPYEMPGMAVARVRGGKAAEQTADTGQTGFRKITPGTRKVSMTAGKFAAEVLVSKEEEEDSLIPIIPFLQEEVTSQLANDMEDAVINGDTAGSHMDVDVTLSDDPRKIWDGLRKLAAAGAKTDGAGAGATASQLRVNRKKMGKYGVDSSQIVHLLSIAGYVNLLSDVNVITVDKYGPDATIKTGELAKIDGVPIIVSQYVRDNLNATGIFDNTTTTKTEAITVRPSAYVVGSRRNLTVQLLRELYAEFDQDAIAVSMRKAFVPLYPAATELAVSLTYNLPN